MAKPTIYIETWIISYLASWPSRDLLTAANQAATHEWWSRHRQRFTATISPLVLAEIVRGDADASARRLGFVRGLRLLAESDEAESLAQRVLVESKLPRKALFDCKHIAISACNGIEFFLTWNCRHIANAMVRPAIERTCREAGYEPPTITTPTGLLGDSGDVPRSDR